jgi:hypothetical protein
LRCLVAAFAPRHELIDAQFVPSGNAVVEIVQGWLFSPPCWRRAAVIELSDGIAAALDAHIVLTLPNQGSRSSAGILDRPYGTILRGAPNRFGKALLASQLAIFVARNAAAAPFNLWPMQKVSAARLRARANGLGLWQLACSDVGQSMAKAPTLKSDGQPDRRFPAGGAPGGKTLHSFHMPCRQRRRHNTGAGRQRTGATTKIPCARPPDGRMAVTRAMRGALLLA